MALLEPLSTDDRRRVLDGGLRPTKQTDFTVGDLITSMEQEPEIRAERRSVFENDLPFTNSRFQNSLPRGTRGALQTAQIQINKKTKGQNNQIIYLIIIVNML